MLFQVKGKNFFFPFFIPFKIFIEASNQSCKQSIHRNIYILPTSFPNNDNASIYKPKCDFPMRKTMIFFCLFFVKTTHKRESTLILVQRSAPQCSMMIPIQLQMFASSLALMAQLFVLFLPSLRPLVARRAYWATQVALTFEHGDCIRGVY